MKRLGYAGSITVTLGLVVLIAMTATAQTQTALNTAVTTMPGHSDNSMAILDANNRTQVTPTPQPEQKTAARVPDPANTTAEDAILSGLSLTEDQKAKIAGFHKELRNHVDLVIKDNRNTKDQKEALIEGMRRMERREVFMVLTPEQQQEVMKKSASKSAAGQKSNTP